MCSDSLKAGTEDREGWCGGVSGAQTGDKPHEVAEQRESDIQDG